ncbi:glycosyltransferase family 28 domain-containing [Fusarium albosuccineum]|uniref:Glycosyltransferase family 28 domain-containing n=1 Tax=Fusarium albosuccineum TaxID=1237068 RepID=A0A8H4L6H6_9HYPO|nr:glycosyltransferase family 28 domain-containing [Fusarium albosuccineum]
MDELAPQTPVEAHDSMSMPKLNIVIMGFGSRGDLEPTLEIAKVLQFQYGHRVRYVTHERHKHIVQAAGIEFYSLGRADPREMIARRSRGSKEMRRILPEIQDEFAEMGQRYWGACIDDPAGIPDGTSPDPFVADAIIATMTTFVHSSAAARMGIPIHLQANNPRIFSKYIPHSQAESSGNSTSVVRNVLSWWLKDLAFLLMLNSGFNKLRVETMGLESFSPIWWQSHFMRFRLPCSNLWSPHLLANPSDWGDEIDTVGYAFADEEPFSPPAELLEWLDKGDEPIYVGFGSMSFPNSDQVLEAIFDGIAKAGKRIIYAQGWSGTSDDRFNRDDVFVVNEIPHHWLFPRVAAVVIHMGAGTTSMAIKTGKPITMIPIAGDQPFWAPRVHRAGCGPEPIPLQDVTSEIIYARVQEALSSEMLASVRSMAEKIRQEEPGQFAFARSALRTFERSYSKGRCDLLSDRPAVWRHRKSGRKLSPIAAGILVDEGQMRQTDLDLIRYVDSPDLKSVGDPITGALGGIALVGGRVVSAIKSLRNLGFAETLRKGAGQVLADVVRIATSPITFLHAVSYGFYSLAEYLTFSLGSVSHPQQFDSNRWTYSYWSMLQLLLLAPLKELDPIRNTPTTLVLSPLRFALSLVNIPIGFVAFTTRVMDVKLEQLIGKRPSVDVVYEARVGQGCREMKLASNELRRQVIGAWEVKNR